jgi:hypothetical protein
MTRSCGWSAGLTVGLLIFVTNTAAAQLMSICVPDSSRERGEIGCSTIQGKTLPEGLTESVFWHIDRCDSTDRARGAVGPASIAFDPAGAWWLMTIERDTMDHRGGQHVTQVRPPAASSREIHHDGRIRRVHARHVLASTSSFRCRSRLRARARSVLRDSGSRRKAAEGRTLALPGDTPMRAVVTGSARRHVLAVIVHDAAQPATMRMEEGAGPKLAACK